MKKILLILSGIMMITSIMAQVPQGITHQAVMRDSQNQPIVESPIGVRISILQGGVDGEAVYVETHNPITNANGLITYVIGQGAVESGLFAEIDWTEGPYFLKTESDPSGGNDYIISGVTQFLSVPYAFFAESFSGLEELLARIEALEEALEIGEPEPGTVTDIDGNVYQTVIIGNQEWMAENLRVTKYNNGDAIPTGLSDGEWENTTSGAYAIFDHNYGNADGINSPEEMVAAYGKLYNWYAVDDSRGLCPAGWSVPSDDDWTQLVDFLIDEYDYHNDWWSDDVNGVGNSLKSCRQAGSPLEGCNTSEHPRWNSDSIHYGFDKFGFSALPGGYRWSHGYYGAIGYHGSLWTSTEYSSTTVWNRPMNKSHGGVGLANEDKRIGFSVRCFRAISEEPTLYNLNLEVHPESAGSISGTGEYQPGEVVSITATGNEGWEFVNWTDCEGELVSGEAVFTFTMPAKDVTLTASFQPSVIYGDGVTDIDGNVYQTVIIGNQEWMAENLRVTRYNNGHDIITGLNNNDWQNTTDGAFTVYPHEYAEGISSSEEMVEAYGILYNWYAVNDPGGVCPEGWIIPSDDEWNELIDYVADQGYSNDDLENPVGAGNALKSCLEVNSPFGGDCDTSLHPRWDEVAPWAEEHHGFDAFGFSALPAGAQSLNGSFGSLGVFTTWWSHSEHSSNSGRHWGLGYEFMGGKVMNWHSSKWMGRSLRCVKAELHNTDQ